MILQETKKSSWLDVSLARWFPLNLETGLIALILVLAVLSRFVGLGDRAMSHDEVNHVVPSYELSQGQGYQYDPLSHGPLQFHLIALSYFLFGDNDFTSRIPAALFSVATVAFGMLAFRRYLGRVGALAAGLMFLISPYMLFYGRYARNEAFIVIWGMLSIYAILRYLEQGESWVLVLFTVANALHFTDKATAYIFAAEQMIFLGGYLLVRLWRGKWPDLRQREWFFLLLAAMLGVLLVALGLYSRGTGSRLLEIGLVGIAAGLGIAAVVVLVRAPGWKTLRDERELDLLLLLVSLVLPLSAALPVKAIGFNPLDYSAVGIGRSAVFIGLLAAVAASIGLWWRPSLWALCAAIFYSIFTLLYTTFFTNPSGLVGGLMGALGYWMNQQGVDRGSQPLYYYLLLQIPVYEFLPAFGALLAAWVGLRRRLWVAQPAAPFLPEENHLPVVVTGGHDGGSDHGSHDPASRDNGHHAPIGAGVYPLPAEAIEEPASAAEINAAQRSADTVLARAEERENAKAAVVPALAAAPAAASTLQPVPTLALILFWSVSSLASFTAAGEKMPWLTIHITMPMILASGWAVGYLFSRVERDLFRRPRNWAVFVLLPILAAGVVEIIAPIGRLLGHMALQQDPATLALGVGAVVLGGWALGALVNGWRTEGPAERSVPGRSAWGQLARVAVLTGMAVLAVITARAAFRAAFILYDDPLEYLVYAHGSPDPKRLLGTLSQIASQTNAGNGLVVAYDNNTRYPYWWYLRNDPNRIDYDNRPTSDLRRAAVIFVGEPNYNRLAPVLQNDYISFDYIRLWWPNQDYFRIKYDNIAAERPDRAKPMDLGQYLQGVWRHIQPFFTDERVRSAIWQIWFNRNYTEYAALQHSDAFSLVTWEPADRMRMYIRKDIAARAGFAVAGGAQVSHPVDPYANVTSALPQANVLGGSGSQPGQFQAPHALALAPDGSLYAADTGNNRIQHLGLDGKSLGVWGSFADVNQGEAPGGTFNQPWGVAVAPDGSVYVSDTWNHRVQHFSPEGKFLNMWGHMGQGGAPEEFYGPRGIAVDRSGDVYVADTGNKRVVVFNASGAPKTVIGGGTGPVQFNEPVGIALDARGNIYVADTWNQRVQVLAPADGGQYSVKTVWAVDGWYGQGIDNKPFLAVDSQLNTYVTDPEACRVLEFSSAGGPIHVWNACSNAASSTTLPSGIAVDPGGGVWLSDAGSGQIVNFQGK
jgi:predicted membrane-bound mannosyltransferase/sugar lactone lactonase YvrE